MAMRTIIDITDEQVKALDEISELEKTSRAALIRQAIDRMLVEDARSGEAAQAAFGLWSHTKKDGLEIEALLRRGKVEPEAPKAEARKPKPAQPPVAPVIEDSFVTQPPEPVVTEAPKVAAPPPPPPPPVATPQSASDPLAAFFAGVKP